MLVPAMLYKEELVKKFTEYIYSDDYFYYMGYCHQHNVPDIDYIDYRYQYAITNSDKKLIGYLAYMVDAITDTAYNFGLFSFDRGNPVIGRDLFQIMEELYRKYRKLEYKVVSGNPVIKHYDRFCKKYGGRRIVMYDTCRDNHGKFHDSIIYEVFRDKKFKWKEEEKDEI